MVAGHGEVECPGCGVISMVESKKYLDENEIVFVYTCKICGKQRKIRKN
jgi:transcription elongation factor Elf1